MISILPIFHDKISRALYEMLFLHHDALKWKIHLNGNNGDLKILFKNQKKTDSFNFLQRSLLKKTMSFVKKVLQIICMYFL